jgi:adenylate cyclase
MVWGRNPECDQEVRDANASRRHLRFSLQNDRLSVHDLNSFNGTFVNEERLKAPRDLRPGDVLRLGESRFVVEQEGVPAAAPRRPTGPPVLGKIGNTLFGFTDTFDSGNESVVSLKAAISGGQNTNAAQLEKRLNAVLRMSEALGTLRTTEETLQKILEGLFDVFPQAARGFLLLGDDVEKLRPAAARNRQGQDVSDKIDISRTIVGRALKERAAVLFTDGGDLKHNLSIVALQIRSAMVVPLVVKEEVLGVLSIDTDNPLKSFNQDDLSVASAAASQASVALKNALLNERVEQDALTRQNLVRFLPGPLATQAMEGKIDLKLGGSKVRGTIFFSDVVGFTTMSETLPPEAVVAVLNGYFDLMVAAISDNHGAIDKYLGDAIMAFWGIPLDQDGRAATNACIAGLQMQNLLWSLNYQLAGEGKPTLAHGIGINTGEVIAGNIGSSRRVEYTVIGDNVNLAQRLESRAARSQVLISESTLLDTQGSAFGVALAPSSVKGKQEKVKPVSLRGVTIDANTSLLHFPLVSQDGTPLVITSSFIRGLSGAPEVTVLHPEGHTLGNVMVRPEIAEASDFLPFSLQVLSTQAIVEGDEGQRRYNLSRATPVNLEPRMQAMLFERRTVQGTVDLDGIKRH